MFQVGEEYNTWLLLCVSGEKSHRSFTTLSRKQLQDFACQGNPRVDVDRRLLFPEFSIDEVTDATRIVSSGPGDGISGDERVLQGSLFLCASRSVSLTLSQVLSFL